MKRSLFIVLTASCLSLNGQGVNNCDSIFYRTFYNFVNYNDSIGYSLTYNIDPEYHDCLTDTVRLIRFLFSDRYKIVNSNVIRAKNGDGLAIIEMSYLAHHTYHSRIRPLPDSAYKHVDNWRIQTVGSGSQIVRSSPIDVLKLYFISALFYQDFEFRNEIVLMKKARIVETYTDQRSDREYLERASFEVKIKNEKIIKSALKSHKKWVNELSVSGLNKLRQTNINPLYYTKQVEWRNKQFDPFDGKEKKVDNKELQ